MKSGKFIPPTKEMVEKFAIDNGFPGWLGVRAWQHYEDGAWEDGVWRDTNGKPVKNWKQKIRTNWFNKHEDEHNGRNERPSKPKTGANVFADNLLKFK